MFFICFPLQKRITSAKLVLDNHIRLYANTPTQTLMFHIFMVVVYQILNRLLRQDLSTTMIRAVQRRETNDRFSHISCETVTLHLSNNGVLYALLIDQQNRFTCTAIRGNLYRLALNGCESPITTPMSSREGDYRVSQTQYFCKPTFIFVSHIGQRQLTQ